MKLPVLAALLLFSLPACSDSNDDPSPPDQAMDAGAEQQQDAPADSGHEEEGESSAAGDSASTPEAGPPGDLDSVLGIWAKRTTGDAMISKNTCGSFYMVDFDFKYTRFSKSGPTTLKVEYCKDAACTTVEEGVDKTLEFAGGIATFSKTEPMVIDSTCELTMQEDGSITFETTDYGRFSWKVGLTYKGTGCAQYQDPKMTGDTCEGIAESEIDRVQ